MVEIARINGAMQSSLTQTTRELPIQRERPLPGHQFCLTSIALSIELVKRVGFRVAADAMQILFDMLHLAPLFTSSTMVLYHLKTPGSDSRIGISPERMEAKLGRLREHAEDLRRLNQCQQVIDHSLSVINVDCKATQKWITDSLGRTLTAHRIAAYREAKTADHVISTV